MRIVYLTTFLVLKHCLLVTAGDDSTKTHYRLNEVEIKGKWTQPMRYQNFSLAEMLRMQGNVFIRQYSPGSLATSTIRGTYNVHTPVYWNGFDISNPMNGQQDLVLIPTSISDIRLVAGNLSWHSNEVHIGGGIYLENNNTPTNQAHVSTAFGSFNTFQFQAGVQTTGEKIIWTASAYRQGAQNNFYFQSPVDDKRMRRENAGFLSNGFSINNNLKFSAHSRLETALWIQHAQRALPGSIFTISAKESQTDQQVRFSTGLRWEKDIVSYGVRFGFFKDDLLYINPLLGIRSPSIAYKWQPECWLKTALLSKIQVHFKAGSTWQQGKTDNYEADNRTVQTAYLSASLDLPMQRWRHQLLLKTEHWQTGARTITAPTLSIKNFYYLSDYLHLKAAATHRYRLPTLNELYWQPYGNPNIQAEKAINLETGLAYSSDRWQWHIQLFNNYLQQHIMWQPVLGSGLWRPVNVGTVWARGVELDAKYQFPAGLWILTIGGTAQLTRSTLQHGNEMGKQLIYIPFANYTSSLSASIKNIRFTWRSTYTGLVYTTLDHSESLSPFHIHEAEASYHSNFKLNLWTCEAFIRLHNLTNTTYQLMPGFPMPGRNLHLGLRIQFHINNKSKL